MKIKEAIILAGGMGTRLRDAVPDLPKCMAPVAGQPFLVYVIRYLASQGISKFIFSLGYKHEVIENFLKTNFPALNYESVIEQEPLGTGGAIKLALSKAEEDNVVIVNGDTIFKADVQNAAAFHQQNNADCTLILKPMENFSRYGVVETNNEGRINSFKEKQFYTKGNINGGVYILNKKTFKELSFPDKFSFETDYLETKTKDSKLFGIVDPNYFIDIGIPEDFTKAQTELLTPELDLKKIDRSWTLFLDRDGVVNHDKPGSYIFNNDEFVFFDSVAEAFKTFAQKFDRIIIITNQRGIGKKLMTEDDLAAIHHKMKNGITTAGGKIDGIYFCDSLDNTHFRRKPNPGMVLDAKLDFPDIDFAKAIMVGNKMSDMEMGRNAGINTIFIATTNSETPFPHPNIDLRFDLLTDFAKAL